MENDSEGRVILEPDPNGILSQAGSTFEGFGCKPDTAYVLLRGRDGIRRRLLIAKVQLEDGTEDWSFGIEPAPESPVTWTEDELFPR